MILTDCYPLKLSGTANSTSAENETAAASKAVAGVKFGSTFVARTSCFVHPEEQLGLHKKVSTDHHTAKIQQKVMWPNLFLFSLPFIAITLHSTFIHFQYWNFAVFVDLSDAFRKLVSFMPVKPTSSYCLTATCMQILWHVSRPKHRIYFAFMLVITNALKSKCRFQSTDYEHKMLLVTLK